MIGSIIFIQTVGVAYSLLEAGTDQHIIDAPSDAAGTGIGEIAPPRPLLVGRMTLTVGIHPAIGLEGGESGTFFVGKSGGAGLAFRGMDIQFGVGHVEISTSDDGLSGGGSEPVEIGSPGYVPLLTIGQTLQLGLRIRSVGRYHEVGRIFQGENTSFREHISGNGRTEFGGPTGKVTVRCIRFVLRENRGSTVAFAGSGMDIEMLKPSVRTEGFKISLRM